uniref:Reverse transcriptase zinc-binding domain-containing protein n=1 Tax=Cannabis sativa TaxID=3483 RepID=A0A803QPB9_CANSA
MRKRIFSWETKFLSKAGKEILIKLVAQALPSYAMSVFLLTKEICASLEGMMAKFWWKAQSNSSSKGVSWFSWKCLCQHKHVGGLGFRDLCDYNLSFLGKQGWRLLTKKDTLLERIYKARYYPNGSFLQAKLGQNPSFIWRSIWEAQALVRNGARRSIGSGASVSILLDPWLPMGSNPFVILDHQGLVDKKVASLMSVGEKSWDLEILDDMFVERDKNLIMSIQLSDSTEEDLWYWHMEHSGLYTVKSVYKFLQFAAGNWLHLEEDNCWKKLWKLDVPPKVQHFLWRACTSCLPTKDFSSWFFALLEEDRGDVILDAAMLIWSLWKTRNEVLWQKKSATALRVVKSARHVLNQWMVARSQQSLFQTGVSFHCNQWRKPENFHIKVNVDGAIFEAFQKVRVWLCGS